MKAPVGLLSDRTVLRSKMEGPRPDKFTLTQLDFVVIYPTIEYGDFQSVQGNTGHATASVLMDTYAHTQDKPRLELTEKIEANFYSQNLTPATSQPQQNEKPVATKISGKEILEAIRLMDAGERGELTRALFT